MNTTLCFFLIIVVAGIMVVTEMLTALMVAVVDSLQKFVQKKKREHQCKHKFEHPPMAACYCKDCVYHMENQRICVKSRNWKSTRDDWFCADAIPRKTE